MALLGASACTSTPEPQGPQAAGPVEPVDAFEKVGEPERTYPNVSGDEPSNLSTDVERLQDAHRQYQHDKDVEAAEHRHSQAKCLKSGEGRNVPIDDGSDTGAVYCQK